METKQITKRLCGKCNEEFEATLEYFSKENNKLGLSRKCRKCLREYNRNWRKKNPDSQRKWQKNNKEKLRDFHREWRSKNIEKSRQSVRDSYRKNKEKNKFSIAESQRKSNLKKKYGISTDVFNKLSEQQNNKCLICQNEPWHSKKDNKYLTVDHDHKCCKGKISCGKCLRGLICSSCNLILGYCGEDINILESCIQYLLKKPKLIKEC